MKNSAVATTQRGVIEVSMDDLDVSFWVRLKPDPDRVLYLAELMDNGVEIDPIVVWLKQETNKYVVRDGRHRIEAARFLDRTSIKCKVVPAPKNSAEEISLAYQANLGGALPPTKEDTEHTVRLLLSQGVAGRDIAKLLPLPPSLARRYVDNVASKQAKMKLRQAIEAVADGEMSAVQAAATYNVDIDTLRKELGGRKKKGKQAAVQIKHNLGKQYRSLSQKNASILKALFSGLDDGEVSIATIETVIAHMHEANRKLTITLRGWTQRLEQAKNTVSK